ncbi:hypothetical protein A9196_20880 [Aeromonas dhakensis]|nr:hypothetical protein A9196_20880 [Aeromonas dhakensis]
MGLCLRNKLNANVSMGLSNQFLDPIKRGVMGRGIELHYTFQLREQHQPNTGFKGVEAFFLAVTVMREAVAVLLTFSGNEQSFTTGTMTTGCKSSFNIIDRDNCTGLGLNCEGYFILKVHQSVT